METTPRSGYEMYCGDEMKPRIGVWWGDAGYLPDSRTVVVCIARASLRNVPGVVEAAQQIHAALAEECERGSYKVEVDTGEGVARIWAPWTSYAVLERAVDMVRA